LAKDPVCKMDVNEKTAKLKSDYNGKTYYFCSASCKTNFDKNPSKYVR
jgi:YHS domain-containing protein